MTRPSLPFLAPPGPDNSVDLPSLSTPIAQVFSPELNPHNDRALQQKTVVSWLDDNGYSDLASKMLSCGTNYAYLRCPNGHEKYAKLHCKLEFCPDCGARGSRIHKTRATRARDRLLWAPVLGYAVFTLPGDLAASHLSKDTLKRLEQEAGKIVMTHFGAAGGSNRIHFAGDALGHLQIHVNVLFALENTNGIGKVDKAILDAARDAWTVFVNSHFNRTEKTTVFHYSFATTGPKKANKIKYVFRPIIDAFKFMVLPDEDKHYIVGLRGWHNTRWFGKLSNSTYKKYLTGKGIEYQKHQNDDAYLSKICPVCGEKFRYIETVHKYDLPIYRLRRLDNDTLVDFEVFNALQTGKKSGGIFSAANETEGGLRPCSAPPQTPPKSAPVAPCFSFMS